MNYPFLLGFFRIEKTLPWSQTEISKGVKIATNRCNPHAFGVFSIEVKFRNSNGFSKKWLSLPNKRPNEF